MSTCREFKKDLARHFEGRLSIERVLLLERHAQDCEACAVRLLAEQALLEGLRSLPEPPSDRIELERAVAAVNAGIDARSEVTAGRDVLLPEEVAAWAGLQQSFTGRQFAALAAGILALLAGIAWMTRGAGERTAVEPPVVALVPEPEVATEFEPSAVEEPLAPWRPRLDESAVVRTVADSSPPREGWAREDFDLARREEARKQVEEALLSASRERSLDADSEEGTWLADFDERVSELRRAGWPVLSLVRRAVHSNSDATCVAALRFLGQRGGRAEIATLERALAREPLRDAALEALFDLGRECYPALGRAYWSTYTGEVFKRRLDGLSDVEALACIDQCLAQGITSLRGSARGTSAASAETRRGAQGLLDRLVALDFDAGGALLERSASPLFHPDDWIPSLTRCADARPSLLAELERERPRLEPERLIEALRAVRPPQALPWLFERAYRGDVAAARALGDYEDPEALLALLQVERDRRIEPAIFLTIWEGAVQRSPEAAESLAWLVLDARAELDARHLFERLRLSSGAAAMPAMIVLCASADIPREARGEVLELLARSGEASHLARLERLFGQLGPRDSHVAAACLLALHRLSQGAAPPALLEPLPASSRARLLRWLESTTEGESPTNTPRSNRQTLYLIQRELEAQLDTLNPLRNEAL